MKFNFFNKPKKEEPKPLNQDKFWKNTEIKGFEDLKDEILGENRLEQTKGNFLKSEQKDSEN
ncbi:MAG: hypothetical protein QG630_95 [Patescibacteria group bacterium]|nr:hypothetical protein [Patescibacteria group bacterium]